MGAKYNIELWRLWVRYTPGVSLEILTRHKGAGGWFAPASWHWRCRYSKRFDTKKEHPND